MEAYHLNNGGKLVEGVTYVLLGDLIGNVIDIDGERFLRSAGNGDLEKQEVAFASN